MALVACPECKREISNAAAACPHCGSPMNDPGKAVTTIQATGKLYKAMELAGAALIAIGVVSCVNAKEPGAHGAAALIICAGLILAAAGRFLAWWKHG